MEIIKVKIDELIENSWNPNRFQDKKFDLLVQQIKKNGMVQPLLVRRLVEIDNINPFAKYQIIDGEHRKNAAQVVGLTELDVVVVDLNEKQSKALTIAMNSLKGKMNDVKLAKLLEQLKNGGLDLNDTGLTEKETKFLFSILELPEDLSGITETGEKLFTLSIVLPEKDFLFVQEVLRKISMDDMPFAITKLCDFYEKSVEKG